MAKPFALEPPTARKRPTFNRQSPGEAPQEAPITICAWSSRNPDDPAASYHMIEIWDHVPPNITKALVDLGAGAGTYLLTDGAGRKSRWIVKPAQLAGLTSDDDEIDGEIDTRSDFERQLEQYRQIKEIMEPHPEPERLPNPGASGVDWGQIIKGVVPMLAPLVQVLIKKLSPEVTATAQSAAATASAAASAAASSVSSAWVDFARWAESVGIDPDVIRDQIEAAIAAGGGS